MKSIKSYNRQFDSGDNGNKTLCTKNKKTLTAIKVVVIIPDLTENRLKHLSCDIVQDQKLIKNNFMSVRCEYVWNNWKLISRAYNTQQLFKVELKISTTSLFTHNILLRQEIFFKKQLHHIFTSLFWRYVNWNITNCRYLRTSYIST